MTKPKMIFYNPAKAILRVLKLPHKVEKENPISYVSPSVVMETVTFWGEGVYNTEAVKC